MADETVTYFHYGLPVFIHDKDDRNSFRLILAQLHVNCGAKQVTLASVFGIPKITLKRAVKLYNDEGTKGFFAPRQTRGATVLTDTVIEQAQSQLNEGKTPRLVATTLGIKTYTLNKAIRAGRLHALKKHDLHRSKSY